MLLTTNSYNQLANNVLHNTTATILHKNRSWEDAIGLHFCCVLLWRRNTCTDIKTGTHTDLIGKHVLWNVLKQSLVC